MLMWPRLLLSSFFRSKKREDEKHAFVKWDQTHGPIYICHEPGLCLQPLEVMMFGSVELRCFVGTRVYEIAWKRPFTHES